MRRVLLLTLLGLPLPAGSCVDPGRDTRRVKLGQPDAAGKDAGSHCGAITYQGCCVGDTLRYCADGEIVSSSCGPGLHCGWDPLFSVYGCGGSSAADPAGLPRGCPLDAGVVADAPRDAPRSDLSSCGGISFAGCCSGAQLFFCAGGKVLGLDCGKDPLCGWNAAQGYYGCGTAGQADPSGKHPKACSSIPPDSGAPDRRREAGADRGKLDQRTEPRRDAVPHDERRPGDGRRDRRGSDAAGLDPSGLEVGRRDTVGPGEDGCGCEVGATGSDGRLVGLLALLLIGCASISRPRRRS